MSQNLSISPSQCLSQCSVSKSQSQSVLRLFSRIAVSQNFGKKLSFAPVCKSSLEISFLLSSLISDCHSLLLPHEDCLIVVWVYSDGFAKHRRVSSVKIIRFLRQTHFSFPSKRKEPKIFSRKLLFCNPLTRFEIWAYLQKILRVILVTAAWKRQVRGDLSAPMISLTLFLVLWQCYQAKEFLSQKESWVYHRPTVFENH